MTAGGGHVDLRGVRACLFDLDGTLIHQRIDFGLMRERVREALARHGADTAPWEGLHLLEMIERAHTDLARSREAHADAARDAAHRAIEEIERGAAALAAPMDGAVGLLDALRRAGIGVGIVTRNSRAAVERVLARHPIPHDVLLTRDDVARVKPDPQHLQDALDALGVPGRCALMCGDHPMDVVAGRGVGALTVGVLPPGQGAAHFSEVPPDLVVGSVAELGAHLRLGDGRG